MAIPPLNPGKVGFSDYLRITGTFEFFCKVRKLSIPAPRVDADNLHPLLQQIERAFPIHPGTGDRIFRGSPGGISSGPDENNVERFNCIIDAATLVFDVVHNDSEMRT